jgi:hypothetical protein
MPRVFASLAVADLILLLGGAGLGFFDPAPNRDRHVLLAVLALLLACLVQVLSFTYLAVSGKVLTQAVHLGKLPLDPVDRGKEIKKRFARCVGAVVLLMVLVVATGAAAWRVETPPPYHFPAVAVFACGWVFIHVRELGLIAENARLMEQTLAEYAKARPMTVRAAVQAGAREPGRLMTSRENECPTQ